MNFVAVVNSPHNDWCTSNSDVIILTEHVLTQVVGPALSQ